MIKISAITLLNIIKICGKVAKKAIIYDVDYFSECKDRISEHLGIPDLFNNTDK